MRYFFALLLMIGAASIQAQISIPTYVGARATSMGGYYLTLQHTEALFGNIAGTAYAENFGAVVGAERRFSLVALQQVTAGALVPTDLGAFGLTLNQSGNRDNAEQRVGLSYARKFTEGMSIGARFDYLRLDQNEYGSRGFLSAELGLQSEINREITVGMHWRFPFVESVPDQNLTILTSQIGLGVHYQPGDRALLAISVEKQIDFPLRVRSGLEYTLTDELIARVGIATGGSRSNVEYAFGIGWQFAEDFRLDLGTSRHSYLNWTPGLTLVYGDF